MSRLPKSRSHTTARVLLFLTTLLCTPLLLAVPLPTRAQVAVPDQVDEATAIYDGFRIEYYVPGAPRNVAVEGVGKVWFTSPDADGLGLVEVLSDLEAGPVRYRVSFFATGRGSMPYDLVYENGVIWFSLRDAGKIGRMDTTTRALTLIDMPNADRPTGIDTGNNRVWIGTVGGLIYSFDPATTTFRSYSNWDSVAPQKPRIEDVIFQDTRSIWFSMPDEDAVGELNSIGERLFYSPTPGSHPVGLTIEGGRRLWATVKDSSRILRLVAETRGDWIAYDTPTPASGPSGITTAPGPRGPEIWFTDFDAGTVSRLRFDSLLQLLDRESTQLAASGARPFGITTGPDLHLWVTDMGRGVIYELTPPYIFKHHLPILH